MAPFCEKGDGVTMAENPSLCSLGPRPCPCAELSDPPNPVTHPLFFSFDTTSQQPHPSILPPSCSGRTLLQLRYLCHPNV